MRVIPIRFAPIMKMMDFLFRTRDDALEPNSDDEYEEHDEMYSCMRDVMDVNRAQLIQLKADKRKLETCIDFDEIVRYIWDESMDFELVKEFMRHPCSKQYYRLEGDKWFRGAQLCIAGDE